MMFQKDEVVWAKVTGFPWWPGVVSFIIYIIFSVLLTVKSKINII